MRRRLFLSTLAMPFLPAMPTGLPRRAAAPSFNASAIEASVSQYFKTDAGVATFAWVAGTGGFLHPSQRTRKAKA